MILQNIVKHGKFLNLIRKNELIDQFDNIPNQCAKKQFFSILNSILDSGFRTFFERGKNLFMLFKSSFSSRVRVSLIRLNVPL